MRDEVRNDNVEKALKILKKKLFDDGAIKEAMERRYFEKPSVTRRRKHKEAVNRTRKAREKELVKQELVRQRRR